MPNTKLEILEDDLAPPFDYNSRKKESRPPMPRYSVWNPNPQDLNAKKTPGIVITKKSGNIKTREIVDKVRAVILYSSPTRQLGRGSGDNFKVVCQSHDGVEPSLRVAEPLCRRVNAQDIARVFSNWKGYDEARVHAQVDEVTRGGTNLQVCGLKGATGLITLCPFGKKDEVTGQAAACKQMMFVHALDLDRGLEFAMSLKGGSLSYTEKYVAPLHIFFKLLRDQEVVENGVKRGVPCHAYEVTLSALPSGNYYVLNVSDYKYIEDENERNKLHEKALEARNRYLASAFWTPEKNPAKQEPKFPSPVEEVTIDSDDVNF